MRIYLVDHYDSFTNNVVAWLYGDERVSDVVVIRYDDAFAMRQVVESAGPIVVSPGPRSPSEAAATLDLLRNKLSEVPILGICLGHQMLALLSGLKIDRIADPRHGITRRVIPSGQESLFGNELVPFSAAVYNSLGATGEPKADHWSVTARSETGEIMAIAYEGPGAPAWGWQFHPESFLSGPDKKLRTRWIDACVLWFENEKSLSPRLGAFADAFINEQR